MINSLSGFLIVFCFGPENVGDKCLRVAVVEGEPAGLDLYHDAVAGLEDVVGGGECEAIEEGFVRGEGFGCGEAFAIAAAEDVSSDH